MAVQTVQSLRSVQAVQADQCLARFKVQIPATLRLLNRFWILDSDRITAIPFFALPLLNKIQIDNCNSFRPPCVSHRQLISKSDLYPLTMSLLKVR
jgi:hypothetical protein